MNSPWMTADEVATYALCHIQTVYKAQRSGALTAAQSCVGGKLRIHRDDVDRWLRGQTQPVKRRGPRRGRRHLSKVG